MEKNTFHINHELSLREFLKEILRPFTPYILGLILVAFLWAIDLSLSPYIIKIILDKVSSASVATLTQDLYWPILGYIGLSLFFNLNYRLNGYIHLKFVPALRQSVIKKLVNHLIDQSHTFFQNTFPGALVNKINNVAFGTSEITTALIDKFFGHILIFIIACFTVFTVHPIFSLALTLWIVSFLIVSIYASKKVYVLSETLSAKNSELTGNIVDVLSNTSIIRFFSSKKHEMDNLDRWTTETLLAERKMRWFIFKLNTFQGFSFIFMQFFSLVLLIYGRQHGFITVGDFALILSINGTIIEILWDLSTDFSEFMETLGRVTEGLRLTTMPHEIKDIDPAVPLQVNKGEIAFQNVKFQFSDAEPLFSKKSIVIPGKQKVGLVGYSGSGKTTFLNLMLRLYDIQSGQILIDGQDIQKVTQESLRKAISIIPQDPSLFHRTLMENIRYGRFEASDEEVFEAARRAHAHEFIMKLPKGYQSLVGERGTKLSGGQRQRIAIARAVLKNAPILLLDEATSALDSVTEKLIQDSLQFLMQDKTTIVIAHRLSTLLHMDRILVFDKGKIIEDGNHLSLLAKNGLYKKMWEAQVGGFLPDKF